jgi:hypothetical protein
MNPHLQPPLKHPLKPPLKPGLKAIAAALLIQAQGLAAAEFNKAEWDNPSQPGSCIWIKNPGAMPVRIESFFVRDNGIHTYNEIALKAGPGKRYFKVTHPVHGQWARLTPVDGKTVKLRIRAKDSMLVQEFEYGNKLRAKKGKKVLAEQYVLDLKAIANTGDTSVVKISQAADSYYIGANGSWSEPDQDGD